MVGEIYDKFGFERKELKKRSWKTLNQTDRKKGEKIKIKFATV